VTALVASGTPPLIVQPAALAPTAGTLPSHDRKQTHRTRSPELIAVLVFQVQLGVNVWLLVVEPTEVARRTRVGKATGPS
jgi:hypothetical protein